MVNQPRVARYRQFGDPSVIGVEAQDVPDPGPHDVVVEIRRSGINPLDVKTRAGAQKRPISEGGLIPHTDGAGIIRRLGSDAAGLTEGQRVWVWGVGREVGTAANLAVVPAERVTPLPENASFDLGASLGIPAITAALCLSRHEDRLIVPSTHALAGRSVLVRGGGAVAHFTIQLAKHLGARVVVAASPSKLHAVELAGADASVDRTRPDAQQNLQSLSPDGYDLIVDVSPASNIQSDIDLAAFRATIALYAREGGNSAEVDFRALQAKNITLRSIRTIELPQDEMQWAADTVTWALETGALSVGEANGLPIALFSLDEIGQAHAAVEAPGFHGKALLAL